MSGCGRDATAPRTNQAVAVVVGEYHSCALTAHGNVYCWGNDAAGQLGTYRASERANSIPLPVMSSATFVSITSGATHACGLGDDGQAYCWGLNSSGQLGVGDTVNRWTAMRVQQGGLTFASISAGAVKTCALTSGGTAYCWGNGVATAANGGVPGTVTAPAAISGGLSFASISVGGVQVCGLVASGAGYCWGGNGWYELGVGDKVDRWTPTRVGGGLFFRSINPGYDNTCALTLAGAPFCWGMNTYPLPVTVKGGLTFVSLSNSDNRSCAVTATADAYCWQGIPANATAAAPAEIPGGLRWRMVSGGAGHSCGVTTDGTVYCWGGGEFGELGNGWYGFGESSAVPVKVVGLPEN